MLTAIGATGSAGGGRDVSAQLAKIQRQITDAQKKITDTQGELLKAPNDEARKAIQMQLQALAAQVLMLQQQMNVLRMSQVQKEALESVSKAVGSAGKPSHGSRTNAEGVPIGGTVDVQA
jgi:FlxA-like protein